MIFLGRSSPIDPGSLTPRTSLFTATPVQPTATVVTPSAPKSLDALPGRFPQLAPVPPAVKPPFVPPPILSPIVRPKPVVKPPFVPPLVIPPASSPADKARAFAENVAQQQAVKDALQDTSLWPSGGGGSWRPSQGLPDLDSAVNQQLPRPKSKALLVGGGLAAALLAWKLFL